MIAPYTFLIPLVVGGVAVLASVWLFKRFVSKDADGGVSRRRWMNYTHGAVWGVLLLSLLIIGVASKPSEEIYSSLLVGWGVGGVITLATILVGLFVTGAFEDDDGLWGWRVLRIWSTVGLVILAQGLWSASASPSRIGSSPTSLEYTVAADGSKTSVVAEKYQLVKGESDRWVSVSKESRGGNEPAQVYSWTEARELSASGEVLNASRVTYKSYEDEVVVVDDAPADGKAWVEYRDVFYLAPAGLLDASRPDPIQGKLCVQGRDSGCKVNAKPAYKKIMVHVPAGGK
jgi:hypothetical protein